MLSFAKSKRRIKCHPIPSFERLYKSDRSEKVWAPELQHQLIALARPAMVTAMILVRNTGMRAKDIRTFPWTRYNGTQVQIRSSKTKKLLWIPATRELREHLDALKENKTGALVLLTPSGKAYTRRYFNEHWREDCDLVDATNAAALRQNCGPQLPRQPRHGRDTAVRGRRNAAGGRRGPLLDGGARPADVRGLHGPSRRARRQRVRQTRGLSRAHRRFSGIPSGQKRRREVNDARTVLATKWQLGGPWQLTAQKQV